MSDTLAPAVPMESAPAKKKGLLMDREAPAKAKAVPTTATVTTGWKAAGWFGLLLAVIGFADLSLHLFPTAFGTAEWEFGTVAAMLASLPLPTIGLAAIVAALLVTRARVPSMIMAAVLLLLALLILAALATFLMHVPLALEAAAAPGPQGTAIYRTVARTVIMGVGFGSAYLIAGVLLFRHLTQRSIS